MKIVYSALVSSVSGKLNGSVASRNKGGAYIRNKGVVSNPRTARQNEVRNNFGLLSQKWRELTPAERQSWLDGAAQYPYQDKLQVTRYLTGAQLFVKLNSGLLTVSLPFITVCPTPAVFPLISYPQLAINRDLTPIDPLITMKFGTFEIDYAYVDSVPGNFLAVTEFTAGISPGISSPGTALRLLTAFTPFIASGSGTLELKSVVEQAYNIQYGTQAAGSKIFARVYLISGVTGEVSQQLSVDCLVGITP